MIDEPGSTIATALWAEATGLACSRLLQVEAAAALARARRIGRVGPRRHAHGLELLHAYLADMYIIEVDEPLVARAADLAHLLSLRGYDSLHCASAERLAVPDMIVASADREVLRACSALGLTTVGPTAGS